MKKETKMVLGAVVFGAIAYLTYRMFTKKKKTDGKFKSFVDEDLNFVDEDFSNADGTILNGSMVRSGSYYTFIPMKNSGFLPFSKENRELGLNNYKPQTDNVKIQEKVNGHYYDSRTAARMGFRNPKLSQGIIKIGSPAKFKGIVVPAKDFKRPY